MTDFLNIPGYGPLDVVTARRNKPEKIGRMTRSFAGNARNAQRSVKQSWTITTGDLTQAQIATLEASAPDGAQTTGIVGDLFNNGGAAKTLIVDWQDLPFEQRGAAAYVGAVTLLLTEP